MTERELLDDILDAFRLSKQALKDLANYEKDLIYDAYPRYNKIYLKGLLNRARLYGYKGISNDVKAPDPIYPTRPTEYIIKKKPKNKVGDYRNEKIKTKDKKVCL